MTTTFLRPTARPASVVARAMLGTAAVAALGTTAPAEAAACRAQSGTYRLPLVELYTSEGCSSCPPADRRLQALARTDDPALAPLAWHVTYWDHLGWRDPYAAPAHAERQRRAVALSGGRTLYTPQFFVSGREVRDPGLVATEAQRVARSPAAAVLRAEAAGADAGTWQLAVSATGPADRTLQLVVALTESELASSVTAGENAGERLRHGNVVRQSWAVPFDGGARIDWRQQATLVPAQAAKGLDLVAFVQDMRTGEVLQSLRAPRCVAAGG